MKRSNFTDIQIMYALKWMDAGLGVSDLGHQFRHLL